MTLDERLTEFIEYCTNDADHDLAVDAHLEIFRLRAENTRLDAALAENAKLKAELAAARELLAEIQFRAEFNYPLDAIRETARQIDDHLLSTGHRK